MNDVLALGVAFLLMGVLTVAIEEGRSGLRSLFSFRTVHESAEPIKRLGFHALALMGLLMCLAGLIGGWIFG
jgi:hypothetical protein